MEEVYPNIRNGFVGIATPYYVEKGVKYLQGKNIKNGAIDDDGLIYVSDKFQDKYKKSQLKLNDIVMVQSGHVGECAVIDEKYTNANCHALIILSPKDVKTISSKFLVYYFYSKYGNRLIYQVKTGNTIEHILASEVKKLTPFIPSFPEQTKIANFLTAIDEKISQLTQKYDLLKQYKKGVMQQIFSQKLRFKDDDGQEFPVWKEITIAEIFLRSTHSSKTNYIVNDGKYIIVDMGSISRDAKLLVTKKTNFSNDFLTTCDLVMAKDDIGGGNIIGRVVQIPENKKYICSDHVYKLTIRKGNISYFYYAINSSEINKSFRQKANGTAQIGISKKTVDDQLLPVPSFNGQTKIANFLTAIDDKITQTQTQLDAAKQYKKGLLQQLFV